MKKLSFKEWQILSDLETLGAIPEDFEFSMARGELKTVKRSADRLMKHLKGEGDLEAWVQSKITKANDYLNSAANHLDGGEDDTKKEVKEEKKLKKGTCSCCGNKIKKDGSCGCGSDCKHCGGKHKEPRWQDSDGDGKWYEPGEDVKEEHSKVVSINEGKKMDAKKQAMKDMADTPYETDTKKRRKKGQSILDSLVGKPPTNESIEIEEGNKSGDSSLHDWFTKSKSSDGTPGWVQLGGKYAGKPCAKQPGQKTKPKCGSSKMKSDLSDKEEEKAFRRKNQEDPNPNRKGKAKNVATEGFSDWRSEMTEGYMKIQAGGQTIEKSNGRTIQDTTRGIDNRQTSTNSNRVPPPVTLRSNTSRPTTRPTTTPRPTPTRSVAGSRAGSSAPSSQQPRNVRASGAIRQAFQGIPFLGDVANIVDRYNRRANYADRSPEERRMLGLKDSYEPEGEQIDEKKDACYSKVKSRYSVWPSAYASGALVKCRKVGAANWGNKTKKEEFSLDEKCWAGYEKKGMKTMFGKKYPNCVKKEGYEFSNWRDDFKATEYEFFNIVEPTPLKESEEIRYCPKCKKNEKKRECKYGEKYWTMFSVPASIGGGAYDPNEIHPANESVIQPGQLTTEDYQRLQSTGNVFSIMLMWRGKPYRLQLFFSGGQRPTREEVKNEIEKIYPGAILTHYYPSPSDPNQPIVVIQR